jgi:hypothetical protein
MHVVFRHPFRLAAAVLVLVVVGVGVWLWTRAGESTPVSEERALDTYRAEARGAEVREPGTPRPGVYTYRVSGWERGGAGPLGVRRDLPEEARYIVRPIRGGFQGELNLSAEHVEGARYRTTVAGLRETWRRTKVTFLGFGRDDRRRLAPSRLFMPARPRPGRAWNAAYRAGDLPVTVRSRVLRAEGVRVAGLELRTLVVQVDSVTGGAHPGTRRETLWWAPSLGLAVRQDLRMDVGGTVKLEVRAQLELESTAPRT